VVRRKAGVELGQVLVPPGVDSQAIVNTLRASS
jgi:hypothetical protein